MRTKSYGFMLVAPPSLSNSETETTSHFPLYQGTRTPAIAYTVFSVLFQALVLSLALSNLQADNATGEEYAPRQNHLAGPNRFSLYPLDSSAPRRGNRISGSALNYLV